MTIPYSKVRLTTRRYPVLTDKQLAAMRAQQKAITDRRRAATKCLKNHTYTDKTTYRSPKEGRRYCKICMKDAREYAKIRRYAKLIHDPTDPRHGRFGWRDGCRCVRCLFGRRKQNIADNKRRRAKVASN